MLLAVLTLSTERGRFTWDQAKLRAPVLGQVWRLAALARLSRTLAVQTSNHVPIVRALRLAAAAAGNVYVRRLVRRHRGRRRDGRERDARVP